MKQIQEQNGTPDTTQLVPNTTGADTTKSLQSPTNETASPAVHNEINQMIQYDSIYGSPASRKKND
jgi:hypothetical protein